MTGGGSRRKEEEAGGLSYGRRGEGRRRLWGGGEMEEGLGSGRNLKLGRKQSYLWNALLANWVDDVYMPYTGGANLVNDRLLYSR